MIENPIQRKQLHYPKDFIPSNRINAPNNTRFTFNQKYQIEAQTIRKYDENIDQVARETDLQESIVKQAINQQKFVANFDLIEQDKPLNQHSYCKKPDIDADILKKPRFSQSNSQEISQSYQNNLENSSSPGSIKKQLQNRQIPLPLEDPCRIELMSKTNQKIGKSPISIIKFQSSAEINSKKWLTSQKDLLQKFKESRLRGSSVNQLPSVNKNGLNSSMNGIAKQYYDTFRKRKQSQNSNIGQVNNFIMSMRKKELQQPKNVQFPRFEASVVDKLKQQINQLTRNKKRMHQNMQQSTNSGDDSEQNNDKHSRTYKTNHKKSEPFPNRQLPQYLISYRSSLSYIKDLFLKLQGQQDYKLIVKIPKLFTERLIFKNQQKSELYEVAQSIFGQLKMPCQNIIIKRYTNCTMIIARNICLIWHFDGKRYLGGWQTQYLDQGVKHGLGLEWQPKNYVYYGQFVKNKKEGLGVYKDKNELVYVGYWKKGKRFDYRQGQQQDYNMDRQPSQNFEQYTEPYQSNDQNHEYL